MTGGYMGRMLNVNLSNRILQEEPLDEQLLKNFFGGFGVGARLLYSRQKAGVEPLGPDNNLVFATGPLTGTPVPFGSRYQVMAKSPLTGTWGDANSGGDFGPHLKFSGYDLVLFKGISPTPVYLLIDQGHAELKDAANLWGKDSFDTLASLRQIWGNDIGVACIGPSAEKLSLISGVMNNNGRAAARSGLGAVMGSKRLKAIVARGNLPVSLAHPNELAGTRRKLIDKILTSFAHQNRKYGQSGLVKAMQRGGALPVRNYSVGDCTKGYPDAWEIFGGPAVLKYQIKREGCWHCPQQCGGILKAGTGEYKWEEGALKPEYEGLAAFGSRCDVRDLDAILKANDICNRYGLDTNSTGATISFAMECFVNGIITTSDTEGIDLSWGNARGMVAMTEKLARREGFGDVLADGVKKAAEKIGRGSEEFAMHVHGQEIDASDPRPWPSWGFGYVMDATPARHTVGSAWYAECGWDVPADMGVKKLPAQMYTGKGEDNRRFADWNHIMNALGLCQFGGWCGAYDAQGLIDAIRTVTGWEFNWEQLLEVGDRIAAVRQAFNSREGINPVTDFVLPKRFLGEPPVTSGPLTGVVVDIKALVNDYLIAMHWDPLTARPGKQRLHELGLDDIAKDLWG